MSVAEPCLHVYTAVWCGHCTRYKKIHSEVVGELGRVGVAVELYDSDLDKEACDEEQIEFYPTFKLGGVPGTEDGDKVELYIPNRETAGDVTGPVKIRLGIRE